MQQKHKNMRLKTPKHLHQTSQMFKKWKVSTHDFLKIGN
jgi:hypothetical protein